MAEIAALIMLTLILIEIPLLLLLSALWLAVQGPVTLVQMILPQKPPTASPQPH